MQLWSKLVLLYEYISAAEVKGKCAQYYYRESNMKSFNIFIIYYSASLCDNL